MKVDIEQQSEITMVRLNEKSLDSSNAPEFKTQLLQLISDGATRLVINLGSIKRIDSSGMGALLFGQRQANNKSGWVKLAKVPKSVDQLLKVAMLDRVFQIYKSEEEAIAAGLN